MIASAYLRHDEEAPTHYMRKVVKYSRCNNLKLIIECDASAHYKALESININSRGETLLNLITGSQIDIINREGKSTFITANRKEVLDLILASMSIREDIYGWRMKNEPSTSYHRTITFEIERIRLRMNSRRRPKDTNWEAYKDELQGSVGHVKGVYDSKMELE